MYIATTYIGSAYTPGEVLPDDYPSEKLEWLIRAGAVRESTPAPAPQDCEPDPPGGIAEAPRGPDDDGASADEIDEEAPEIDVMAGIVKADTTAKEERASAREKPPKGGKAR